MKKIKYIIVIFSIVFSGCEYGDLNENPNSPTQVPEILLVEGIMLANVAVNSSHINRIAGMWSGQYKGEQNLYGNIFTYGISTEESNSSWGYIYNGIVAQNDVIQKGLSSDLLIIGITKVIEAQSVGTACSNWGNIPYSEAVTVGIDDPKYDTQAEVYSQLQTLLDEAISNLNSATSYSLSQDIFFNGDKSKWIQTAYTLKARYYMLMKDYPSAYTAAQSGISSGSASMKYNASGASSGRQNLLYEFLSGSRAGDISTDGTFLAGILDGSATSRNNAKTDEDARGKYYYFDRNGGNTAGVAAVTAPMPMVTYEENLLTLAEAAARTTTFATALGHLNTLRSFLASGNAFNVVNGTDVLKYDAYVTADFANGGIENTDGINDTRALLREIVEERYVSGYGTFMPWNDARRLRKADMDVSVPFPLNTGAATAHPERFLLSQKELDSNSNAPIGTTIFDKTEVNQ
ncbi:MAG: SusD/RagB family nutrient-binding outer membrane lipoprotein [Polaribacter sp.]|uniref:SusD/RagB family nutrient-binding outer membrane lipoprotein n=1 Tax=Polaribacter sp. TaxID=1920175 RepID=UPI002F3574D7